MIFSFWIPATRRDVAQASHGVKKLSPNNAIECDRLAPEARIFGRTVCLPGQEPAAPYPV